MSDFNIYDEAGALLCPCCGYPGYAAGPAYPEEGAPGMIGLTICPCCLWEPGFDDNPLATSRAEATPRASLVKYRAAWAATCIWQGKQDRKPPDFDGAEQLERLRQLAPELFPA